jgi:predicted enzyme related to lactoylglutathione lyase
MGGYGLVDTGAWDGAIGAGIGPGGPGRFAVFTDPDGNQVGLWS